MSGKYPGGFVTTGAPAGYSVAFNGSTDYLSFTNNANTNLGTGDFTFEAWVNPSAISTFGMLLAAGGANNYFSIYWGATSSVFGLNAYNGVQDVSSTTTTPIGQWVHVAFVRISGTIYFYINGVATGSGAFASAWGSSTGTATIGFNASYVGQYYMNGHMSNVRLIKGTGIYTSNFTPPTQLFQTSNASLLTCQSPTIIDNSSNAFSITANGNAKVSTFTPFVGYTAGASGFQPALGAAAPGVWTLDEATYYQQNRLWPIYDPYFNQTTLMLHGTGSNTANNSVFVDSSSNNFAITRNGNTTQGTFTPFSQTGWSNYFDGSSSYIYSLNNSAFSLASSAFTIEAWVYITSIAADRPVLTTYVNSSTGWGLSYYSSIGVFGFTASGDGLDIQGTTVIQTNRWYHIAVSGTAGTSMKMFVDGIQNGPTATSNIVDSSGSLIAGYLAGSSYAGYISNARVIKGTALYTTNFTPPTSPLTAVPNTSWLSCQSNRFVDNSSNNFAILTGNAPSVQAFSPFAPTAAYSTSVVGGSGYFDGTSDYLVFGSGQANANFNGNCSIELWFYPTGAAAAGLLTAKYGGTTNQFYINSQANNLIYAEFLGSTTYNKTSTTSFYRNSWNNLLITKSGTTAKMWLNGFYEGAWTVTNVNSSTDAIGVGATQGGATTFSGYISGLSYSNVATQTSTSNITVSTSPLISTANTAALLSFTNAGIIDSAGDNVLEAVGGAAISTVQSKWGGSSMAFNGTNSYLKLPSNVQLAFGTGNFTIEFWIYFNVVNVAQTIIDFRPDATGTSASPYLELTSGGAIIYFLSGGTQITTSALSANTWYHVVLVRNNGIDNRIYINGTQSGSTFSNSSSLLQSGATLGFNRNNGGTSFQYLNGYMDDLRITNGIARYTTNFTPPTSQLQSQ